MEKILGSVRIALVALSISAAAFAQNAVQQSGPVTAGHVPLWIQNGIVKDAGGANGGAAGTNPSEQGLTIRSSGTAPYANAGTGPLNTNDCNYDAPTTNATGYHFLCFSPNAQGGGLIAYGAGGSASPLSLGFNINGTPFPVPAGGFGTVTSVICGSGLNGGTITTTGTCSLNLGNSNTWTAGQTFSGGIGVASSFTATGLVHNSDLANPSVTVNSVSCTLGSSCTIPTSTGTLIVGSTQTSGAAAGAILGNSQSGNTLADTGWAAVTPTLGTGLAGNILVINQVGCSGCSGTDSVMLSPTSLATYFPGGHSTLIGDYAHLGDAGGGHSAAGSVGVSSEGSTINGIHCVLLGNGDTCNGNSSIVIGKSSDVEGAASTVIGINLIDNGGGDILMGASNIGTGSSNVLINSNGISGGSSGLNTYINTGTAPATTGIGSAIAIGFGAHPLASGDVVLGGTVANNLVAGAWTHNVPVIGGGFIDGGNLHPTLTFGSCANLGSWVGGSANGKFTAGANCSSGTFAFSISVYNPAPNGWACVIQDLTTPAATFKQTAIGTPTFNVTGVVNGDVMVMQCNGF